MARLNEPPAPIETIDSLKRKFMRQNRDIARANSTQSLRIRSLENETSRLLAENLGLREQILRLQGEVEKVKAQSITEHNSNVKLQLQAKVLELNVIIAKLGQPATPKKMTPKGRIVRTTPSRTPDQRIWAEGKLPPILENKSYPRKTLEQQEILAISADTALDITDSPDIGPPPVSQFIKEDPVKIDLPTRPRKAESDDLSSLDPTLSINLEQRKKRKDANLGADTRRTSNTATEQESKKSTATLRTGAKRKLSVRDDEDSLGSKKSDSSPEAFQYTRGISEERSQSKAEAPSDKLAGKVTLENASARSIPREKKSAVAGSITPAIASRKVLAPKSVNNSPRKPARPVTLHEEIKVAKADLAKIKTSQHLAQATAPKPSVVTSELSAKETVQRSPEPLPEIPAETNTFSPFETQPSISRAASRDTPPPPELCSGSEGQRPSRRARAAVSYAEPSLRDKMRRPTKELIDAVAADAKLRNPNTGSSVVALNGFKVKAEADVDDDESWKTMPIAAATAVENSPLSSKTAISDSFPDNIATHRKRRESLLGQNECEVSGATAGKAMTALLVSSRKARSEKQEKSLENINLPPKTENVDIYDFDGSPPAVEEGSGQSKKTYQSNGRILKRNTTISGLDDGEGSDIEGPKKADRLISRRRQSTIVPRSSSAPSIESTQAEHVKPLRKVTITSGNVEAEPGATRSDRLAARRRSMML